MWGGCLVPGVCSEAVGLAWWCLEGPWPQEGHHGARTGPGTPLPWQEGKWRMRAPQAQAAPGL